MFLSITNKNISKNDIIMFIVTLLNMINIILNCKSNILTTIITLIIMFIHYKFYDFDKLSLNKKAYYLTVLLISLSGPLMETVIIHYTNGDAWRYGNPFLNWYVPLWLLPGYGMLGMSCLHYYFRNL